MDDIADRLRAHDLDTCPMWKDDADKTVWIDTADALIQESAHLIESLRSDNARLAKQLEEAREALEPFGAFADAFNAHHIRRCGGVPENYDLSDNATIATAGLYRHETYRAVSVGDCRRAAALCRKAIECDHG